MKNYLNKRTFKGIKGELTVKYGVSKSDEIWKYANSEYYKLETDEPDADKTSRSYVFPAVSIYRAIEQYAPGEALGVLRPLTHGRSPSNGVRSPDIINYIIIVLIASFLEK